MFEADMTYIKRGERKIKHLCPIYVYRTIFFLDFIGNSKSFFEMDFIDGKCLILKS